MPDYKTLREMVSHRVTFEFDTVHEGTTYHMVFTGTVGDDGVLKGTIAVAGVEGTFTATKQ